MFLLCSIQPTKLTDTFLRTPLERPTDVLAFLGPTLKQGTAALIAFAVIQEPEADSPFARTMLAGGIWTPDVWRILVEDHFAFELSFAVRARDWFGFGRVVELYVEKIIGHSISPKEMPECKEIDSGILSILVEQKIRLEYQEESTMNQFMTIKQVGAHLKVSAQTIKRLIREGRLVAHRFGQCSYRISEEAVQALLTQTLANKFVAKPAGDQKNKER